MSEPVNKQSLFQKFFNRPVMDSKIHSANTEKKEGILGYFVGPMFMYMVYYALAGSYLMQYYTDVLGLAGGFLTFMPLFSKIFDAITNVIMGRIIDTTHTRQGKARPWILLSGVLICITGILLYAVPRADAKIQLIWIVVSYNLFFAIAFTIYNMSHTLMVPLSTRNSKQRDGLALLTNAGASMIPGALINVVMPILVAKLGVGIEASPAWMKMMSVISIFALPASLIEYYFTKERVTEDSVTESGDSLIQKVSFKDQLKACFQNPYWLIVMGLWVLFQVQTYLNTSSMLYFSNWVAADSVQGGSTKQVLINVIGQAPLGIGVFLLWPLVKKYGKRMVTMIGFGIAAAGSLVILIFHDNFGLVLLGLIVKSFGSLPTYVTSAMLAEVLDDVEYEKDYRVDGLSASVMTIVTTVSLGIAQTIIIAGISACGYIAPASSAQIVHQPEAVRTFFTWCFAGVPMICFAAGSLLMIKYDLEKKVPAITSGLTERRKAEAAARGEVYVSAEEKAKIEEEEQAKAAEEKRIEELKARCAKKGLSFEEEEAKYQAKLAEKKAKAEAKRRKKEKQ